MAARKWANPGCTPEMIYDCDQKIRNSRDMMMNTEEGREAFRKRMMSIWL